MCIRDRFDVRHVPLTLSAVDARYAIVEPARNHGVQWDAAAADLDRQTTNGYPAHLQLFADHAWRLAESTSHTITVDDARHALRSAAGEVEERTLGRDLSASPTGRGELLAGDRCPWRWRQDRGSHGHAGAGGVDHLLPHPGRADHRR